MEHQNVSAAKTFMCTVGSFFLVLAPLLLLIGWALNYDSLLAFLDFNFSSPFITGGKSVSLEETLATITGPDGGFRSMLLPHYFIYAAMPILIAVGLFLAKLLFNKAPWHALAGATLITIGAVYFIGVLGFWLQLPAIAMVAPDQIENILPFLKAITTVQGVLLVSTALSIFVFLGMIVLSVALYQTRIIPRWSAALIALGSSLIIIFAGTENWMVVGSLFMLIGLFPVSMKMLHVDPSEL